jgi:hypothetical protein
LKEHESRLGSISTADGELFAVRRELFAPIPSNVVHDDMYLTLEVIQRVKAKIKEIEPGLPAGVKIVPVYDRSDLILRSIDNLKSTLLEVILTVAIVVLIFLWLLGALRHARGALLGDRSPCPGDQ